MKGKKTFKRLSAWFLAIVLISSNIRWTFTKAQPTGTATEYYNENFETGYNVGDAVSWTPRNSGNTTTTLSVATDSLAMKLSQPNTVGSSQWFSKIFDASGVTGKITLEFDVMASDNVNTFVIVSDASNSKNISQLTIRDNSYFCMDTGDGFPQNHKVTSDNYVKTGTWYHVQYLFDTVAKTYEIKIDNEKTASFSFRESADNIGSIRVGCGSSTKDSAYFDNFKIMNTETSDTIYSENFETGYAIGNSIDWTPRNAGNTSTTIQVGETNKSVCVKQPSTVSSSQWFTKVFDSKGLTGKYEINLRIKADNAANAFFFLTDAANSKSIIQLCIRDNSYFCLDVGDGAPWNHKVTEDGSFKKGEWHDVKFIVDTATSKVSVSINGGGEVSASFKETASNLGAMRIGVGSSTKDTVYIDDIVVKDYVDTSIVVKEEKTIYNQNFEGATTSEWTDATNTSGTTSIIDISSVEGIDDTTASKVLNISKTSSGTGSYLVNKNLSTTLNKGIVTVQVKMMNDKPDATSYFLLTNSNNSVIAQFGLYGADGIAYQVGSEKNAYKAYEVNKWYLFKAVFDTAAQKYNLYVDDEIIASEVSYSNLTDISRIRIGMYNFSKGNVYFDDISVIQDTRDLDYVTVIPDITTLEGEAPILNKRLTIKDTYGFSHTFDVIWDSIKPSDYASEGTFNVNGKLSNGISVVQKVVVVKSQVEDIYNEDFNSDNNAIDMWDNSNSNVNVDRVEYKKGNGCIKINKTGSAASTVLSHSFAHNLDSIYSRVDIRAKLLIDNLNSNAYFAVSDDEGNNLARVELYSEKGTICVRNYGGTNNIGYYGFDEYEENNWYDIRMVFYPAQERFNVYVNDTEIMSNLAYSTVGGVIGQIQIGFTNTNTGNVYFDDVKVTTYTSPQDYEAPALNITTMQGVKPVLPELVNSTYSDGFVDTWKIDWDAVDSSLYSSEGTFNVRGTAASFRSNETFNVEATVFVRKNSDIKYFVDPVNGNDSNDGSTVATAFKTIGKAQEAVRLVNSHMSGDINVYLLDGKYDISDAVVFSGEDSGTNGYYVHWQALDGAKPIFSGGKKVSGWTKVSGKEYYEASVPEAEGYLDNFRQLYVDGERAVRASSGWINAISFVKTDDTYTGLKFKTSDLKEGYTNVEDIFVAHVSSFKYDEWHVSDIVANGTTTTISCAKNGDGLFSWRANTFYCKTTDNYMIINALEELDAEGEWYLDRKANKIYYYPYENQDMSIADAYVTVMNTDQMLKIEGNSKEKAKNIIFEGVCFEYSNWLYPQEYSIGGSQAEALWGQYGLVKDISYGGEVPGAIRLNHTENIQILNCTLSHLAGGGIHVYNDTANTLVEGNVTYDTTAAGIIVGRFCASYLNDDRVETESFTGNNLEGRVKDTIVRNNVVTDTGRDFLQATGISLMAAKRTTVINNIVDNTAYMGIHTRIEVAGYYLTRTDGKYNGNSTDTTLDVGQNIIAYNKIGEANWAHGYGLNDNASIYNFGPSTGTLIYRNNIDSKSSTDWGIYNDDNSHNVIWCENLLNGKNLYISPRCVDKNTIVLKNNHHIGFVLDGFCISSNNSIKATAEGAAVGEQAGLTEDFDNIVKSLPNVSNYHEVYKSYQSLNRTSGKITEGNKYSVAIIDGIGSNTQAEHPAEDAFDGYLNTYWGSGRNFPETYEFTLASQEKLNNIEIYWYDPSGRYYQYRIYTSVTGQDDSWELACDCTGNTTKGFTRDYLNNVSAKYIKIEITNSSLNSVAIREIVVNKQADNPTGITLDKASIETEVGRKITVNATVLPNNAEQTVVWKTSDASVATVKDGVVKTVGVGKAVITAETVNGLTSMCVVNVVDIGTLEIPDPVKVLDFESNSGITFDKNGNVYIKSESGKDGTSGLVIKDTYNALEWNNGVQSIENTALRDAKVSGTIANPLKNSTNILSKGVTISYDRYMPSAHNGFESILRFGDYDVTIQSGWFMFEPKGYEDSHFCFNRETDTCVSTAVGKWVNETYTFDPVTDTVALYRDGELILRENPMTAGTQIGEGNVLEMMRYLANAETITFGGAASWFSTLGVILDNFTLFDEALSDEQVYAYLNTAGKAIGQIEISVKDKDNKTAIEGAVFEIRDTDGKVVETVITDTDGKVVSKPLNIGTLDGENVINPKKYIVVQIKTASGYQIDETEHEIIIVYDKGQNISKYVLNIVNEASGNGNIPKLGDNSSIYAYLAILLSAVIFALLAIILKRKNKLFN